MGWRNNKSAVHRMLYGVKARGPFGPGPGEAEGSRGDLKSNPTCRL